MNATEARQMLLVRAHERIQADTPPSAGWSTADQAWASDEALRLEGENGPPERWLVRRAELAMTRLAQRDPALAAVSGTAPGTTWILVLPVIAAGLVGLAGNVIGPSRQVNLLAPPLLAVLVWNLAVYGLLAVHALTPARPVSAGAGVVPRRGWLASALRWLSERRAAAQPTRASPALHRFALDWALASQGLQTARLATVMHLAAAALAAGALAGLYLRGLAFEFRAGWDSTFLGAEAVHGWLGLLLGPAAWLAGWNLPDAAQLDALRFSKGDGENAARWIHLYAITIAALVLLPRGLLALAAAWRATRLQRQFPLSLEEPYFQRMLRQFSHSQQDTLQRVVVLPYSYQIGPERQAALATALAHELGPGLQLDWLPSMPLGGEDDLQQHWPAAASGQPAPAVVLALFALTATPERETHGAFLSAVQARCAALRPAARCLVAIDESGFRQRLAGAELAGRLAQRRAAWQALVEPAGISPLFLDLAPVLTKVSP